jgi:hypothetical protein
MMRHRIGPIETLGHAVEAGRLLWVLCRGCGHAHKLDPRHLIARSGDLSIARLQSRLRCNRCRKQRATVVVNDEGWPRRD